jgi:hypothetical protein
MSDRQKFLLQLAYKYVPNYSLINDRDRDVFTLRVWIDDTYLICITDVPSLAGTNKFQVRVCEQTQSYYAPSPRVGQLDRIFGKKFRDPNSKFSVIPADKIEEVISHFAFTKKQERNPLKESVVWARKPRDVWY